MSYMTAGKLQAFEALMKEVPGHNHYDSGCDEIPVRSHLDPGGFPLAPDHDIEAFPAVQTAVVAVKVKANVVPIRCVVINQSSLFHDGLLSLWAAQREGLMQCTSIATASRF